MTYHVTAKGKSLMSSIDSVLEVLDLNDGGDFE